MKKRKRTPRFVYRFKWEQVELRVSVRTDTFQRARRKLKTLRHELVRLSAEASVVIGVHGQVKAISVMQVNYNPFDVELELQCPHCGVINYRKEKERCWHYCYSCCKNFPMFLNDNCMNCDADRQVDCLTTHPGIIT